MSRTLVAAATNLAARGYLVVPTDRKSKRGEPVNALFAVARGIEKAIAFRTPERAIAVVAADVVKPTLPPILAAQLPELPAMLRTLGMTVVETSGADAEVHVVASYVQAALDAGDDVVIVGIDKRFAQLVSDRVWWYDANKDARYTPEMVAKRFLVPVAQVAEWLALVGDDDQLPGVAGIGAKGATGLLEKYGSIAGALDKLDELPARTGKALRAAGDALATEQTRAKLDTHRALPVPLADARYTRPAAAVTNALYDELGFVELLASDGVRTEVTLADTPEALGGALAKLGAGPIAIAPLHEADGTLAGIALAAGDGSATYVPFTGIGRTLAGPDALAGWLADPSIAKVVHAREGFAVALARAGLTLAGELGDSAAASHLTQPSNWAPHDLPTVAKHVLGRALVDEDAVRGTGEKRKPWSALAVDRAADLAGQYTDATAAIWSTLSPPLPPALVAEYLALSDTLVRMELAGIGVDAQELVRAEADFAVIEADLTQQIEALAGHPFNINSSKQLGTVLFEELKLPIVSHTKTGWSTSIEALERIDHAHPIVPLVIRWRLLRRLRDSWVVALRDYIADDGRVHSRFHPARSFSGHLVNTAPDLGRVPGRTPEMAKIRRAFVARPGWVLMSVDYNQLGLHVLAHLTKDPALVEPLRGRADMHVLTASAVLEKPTAEIGETERQIGKVVNFATFAGQGPSALALQLGVSAAEAKELTARFDRRYALVRAFQDEQLRLARERGYIVTLAGRKWPIGMLESLDSHDRSYAERMARRATHEGSVADVARRGLLDADRALRAAGLRAQPLLQIVDEVLFEVPESELADASRIAAEAMRNAFKLEVPLVVGVEAGKNWADLQKL